MFVEKENLEKKNLIADAKKKNAEAENQKALSKQNVAEAERLIGQLNVNKAEELRMLLQSCIVDEDRSIVGSEPFFTPILKDKNRDIVINKLIDVVQRF